MVGSGRHFCYYKHFIDIIIAYYCCVIVAKATKHACIIYTIDDFSVVG